MNSSRVGKAFLLLFAASFFLLRFVHLTADYPRNIRWDDGIATDEGWYASAAINQHTWGQPLLPGDMNIPVLMPVWPVVARIAFALGGFSVVTLRATAVLFYFFDVLLVCGLLRRYGARLWIPLFAALAAVNPWSFVFSRSAFLEFPMLAFVLAAVLAAALHHRRPAGNTRAILLLLLCIVSFTAALLLKTTAIALFPVVIYVLLLEVDFRWRPALLRIASVAGGVAALYALYWIACIRPHIQDVTFYLSVVQNTLRLTPRGFIADASRPFRYGLGSDHLLFAFTLLVVPASILWPRFRSLWRDPLFALPAVWFVSFLAFMVKHNNDPARYFAVVLPALFLIAIALLRNPMGSFASLRTAFLGLLILDITANTFQTTAILLHPTYSFANAAQNVGEIVNNDPSASNVVIGDDAHEVSLQANIRPANLLFHSQTIAGQMQSRHPDWWLQFSPIEDGRCFRDVLSDAYTAEARGDWQIFYPGQKLILWRLRPIPGRSLPPLTPQQVAACSPPVYN